MAFDIDGARQAGVTDQQIIDALLPRHSFDLDGARKAGVTDADIASALVQAENGGYQSPAAAEKERESPGFLKSVKGGIYDVKQTAEGMGALVGGAVEKYTPFEDLGRETKEYWLRKHQETGKEAEPYAPTMTFSEADSPSDYWTWFKEQSGRLAPTMAAAAVGAGVGAAGARIAGEVGGGALVRSLVEKSIEKNVQKAVSSGLLKEMGEKELRDMVAKATIREIGAKAGMFGATGVMESGGNYAEVAEKGENAPVTSALSGTAAASLELLGGNIKLIEKFFGPAASKLIGKAFASGDGKAIKGSAMAVTSIANNMGAEALQEGGQELLSILNVVANTDDRLLTAENLTRIKESAAAGGIVGGLGGGMVDVVTGRHGENNTGDGSTGAPQPGQAPDVPTQSGPPTQPDGLTSMGRPLGEALYAESSAAQGGIATEFSRLGDIARVIRQSQPSHPAAAGLAIPRERLAELGERPEYRHLNQRQPDLSSYPAFSKPGPVARVYRDPAPAPAPFEPPAISDQAAAAFERRSLMDRQMANMVSPEVPQPSPTVRRLRTLEEVKANTKGRPDTASQAAEVFANRPETDLEKQLSRREDAQAAFENHTPDLIPQEIRAAVQKMEQEVKLGMAGGLSRDIQTGNAQRFRSTYPAWFQKKTAEKYDKDNGTEFAKSIDRHTVLTAIRKARNGDPLAGRYTPKNIKEITSYGKKTDTTAGTTGILRGLGLTAKQAKAALSRAGHVYESPSGATYYDVADVIEAARAKGFLPAKNTDRPGAETGTAPSSEAAPAKSALEEAGFKLLRDGYTYTKTYNGDGGSRSILFNVKTGADGFSHVTAAHRGAGFAAPSKQLGSFRDQAEAMAAVDREVAEFLPSTSRPVVKENLTTAEANNTPVASTPESATKVDTSREPPVPSHESQNGETKEPERSTGETKRAKQDREVKATEKQHLDDFGEKIGGARKDLAEPTGTKRKREASSEPAWKKKYKAMEKVDGSGRWVIGVVSGRLAGRIVGNSFESMEEAEAAIPLLAVADQFRAYEQDGVWEVYKKVGDRKMLKMTSQSFPSREEAMKHMAKNAVALLEAKTSFGEEILPVPDTVERKGAERRKGNATPEMFMETFAPRAIEFGNWNNQEERQLVMNHAYDGLLDLAEALGVPPKALMLNGDLAIAFGSRGHGLSGAKAHYETDYGVINLTKMSGAGSLGHEWMHALDHYLARLDTKAKSEKVENKRGDSVYPDQRNDHLFQSHGPSYHSEMRAELKAAYDTLIKDLYRKAEQYVEDTTRADQFLGKAREHLKEQLDYVRKDLAEDYASRYTWRKVKKGLHPASAEQLAEFDRLAAVLLEGGSLQTRHVAGKGRYSFGWSYQSNETLDAVNEIYQAVRSRSGFRKEGSGYLDHVAAAMRTYGARVKMFEDAQAGTEKTKKVPTNFAIEAKKMDQARTGDYWSHPHEMVARAFAAYVEDKIAESGGKSDFLVYHAHGGILLPMIDGFIARPYPEGKERVAINKAFDRFVGTLKVRETDKGVALYSKRGRAGSDRVSWEGFPDVVINADLGTAKNHPDYEAAKAGDDAAAVRLVESVLSDETVEKIRKEIGGQKPLVVPVAAEEATGRNKIPLAFAKVLASRLGLEVDGDIVQTVRAHHTGAGAFERIARQPVFDGPVERGATYIIVDDTLTMGGTLANLRGHIEANGGKVLLASTLTGFPGAASMAVSPHFAAELRNKFGNDLESYLQDEFGFGIDQLTNGEAGHLRKALSVDSLRDRIASARNQGQSGKDGTASRRAPLTSHPISPTQLTAEAEAFLGKAGFRNLTDSGALRVVETEAELPEAGGPIVRDGKTSGAYHNGSIYVVRENIATGETAGLLRHEGLHYLLRNDRFFLGKREDILARFERLKALDKQVQAAYAKVPSDTPAANVTEEAAAYFLQDPANAERSLFKLAVAAARAWLIRKGIPLKNWTHADMAALVAQGIRRAAKKATGGKAFTAGSDNILYSKQFGPTIAEKFDIPEEHTVVSAIKGSFSPAKMNAAAAKKAISAARTKLIDRLHPIEQLGETPYILHRMLGNSHAVLATFLQHGPLSWRDQALTVKTKNEGFLPWLHELGDDGRNLFYWMATQRAAKLEAEGRENWLDADARKKIRDEIFEGLSSAERLKKEKEFKKLNEQFQAWNRNVIDIASEAGLLSKEQIDSWMRDFYLPFYRIMENEVTRDEFLQSPAKSKKHISAQIKRLEGGAEKLGDPIENILRNWAHLIQESQRNVARSAAAKAAVPMGLAEAVPPQEAWRSPGARRENMVVSYQENGKAVYLRVNDPDLFNALSEVNVKAFDSSAMRLMMGAKRLLTLGATATPAFRIANLLRDSIHTAVVAKSFTPILDSAKGLAQVWRESQDYIELMASGGGFGQSYIESGDPKAMARGIERIMKREGSGARGNILDTPRRAWALWERIGHASEMAARTQLYTTMKAKGGDHLKAAFEARDLLDFHRSGAGNAMRVLIAVTPFLNARVQGLDRLYLGAKRDPKSFFAKGAMVAGASLLLWLLFKDDDRYQELEDWEKWQYHHAWIGDTHIRLPKAFEVGAIFSSLFESAASVVDGQEEFDFFLRFVGHTLTETFSLNFPAAFGPGIETYANKSFFTGRPLENMAHQRLPAGERANPWTPELLKDLGRGLNISPIKMEHIIRGHTAAFGTMFLTVADAFYRLAADAPPRPALRREDIHGVGRFVRGEQGRTKYATRYYEFAREVEHLAAMVGNYQKLGDFDKARELVGDNIDLLRYRKFVGKVNRRLSVLRKREQQLWANRQMSPEKKRLELDGIASEKNMIYRQAYDRISP